MVDVPRPRGARDRRGRRADQAERISYFYNHHFTNEPQERLADRLLEVAAPEMARVRFVSGGSEANETALQLARLYHVERGEHRALARDLAGAGLPRLHDGHARADRPPRAPGAVRALPRRPTSTSPPSTWRFDPTGEAALDGARPPARGGRAARRSPPSSASR